MMAFLESADQTAMAFNIRFSPCLFFSWPTARTLGFGGDFYPREQRRLFNIVFSPWLFWQ
jgi:hypothetical protein